MIDEVKPANEEAVSSDSTDYGTGVVQSHPCTYVVVHNKSDHDLLLLECVIRHGKAVRGPLNHIWPHGADNDQKYTDRGWAHIDATVNYKVRINGREYVLKLDFNQEGNAKGFIDYQSSHRVVWKVEKKWSGQQWDTHIRYTFEKR